MKFMQVAGLSMVVLLVGSENKPMEGQASRENDRALQELADDASPSSAKDANSQRLKKVADEHPITEEHTQSANELTTVVKETTEILRSMSDEEAVEESLAKLKAARERMSELRQKLVRLRPIPLRQDREFAGTPQGEALVAAMREMTAEWRRVQKDAAEIAEKIRAEVGSLGP